MRARDRTRRRPVAAAAGCTGAVNDERRRHPRGLARARRGGHHDGARPAERSADRVDEAVDWERGQDYWTAGYRPHSSFSRASRPHPMRYC